MNIALLNPFVRYIDKRQNIPIYSEFVLAYDHRMFYAKKGSAKIFVNDKCYNLNENEALIIPPATPYKLKPCDGFEFYIINFDFIYINTYPTPVSPEPYGVFDETKIFEKSTSRIFPLLLSCERETVLDIERIFNAYIKKSTMYREFMSAELKRIIINSLIFTELDKTPDLVKKILAFINKHYSKNLTNIKIAHEFSYHPNYINRVFKEATGKTIKAYITELKLADARKLLKTTTLSINQISELCGFESYSYFIKTFRTHQGIAPLKYRKQNSSQL